MAGPRLTKILWGAAIGAVAGAAIAHVAADPEPTTPIGRLPSPRAGQKRLPGASARGRMLDITSIKDRCAELARLIRKDGVNPKIHEAAKAMVAGKCGGEWCVAPRDWKGECKALFKAITEARSPYAVRYTCDMREADTFSSAERTLFETHAGDCDDFTVVFGALLMSIGYPVTIRVVQAKGSDTWSHVYVLAGVPPTGGAKEWFPLDGSVETKPAGWQAPGAEAALRYGRPSGMITKTLDYPVPSLAG
mgnify:FL=1